MYSLFSLRFWSLCLLSYSSSCQQGAIMTCSPLEAPRWSWSASHRKDLRTVRTSFGLGLIMTSSCLLASFLTSSLSPPTTTHFLLAKRFSGTLLKKEAIAQDFITLISPDEMKVLSVMILFVMAGWRWQQPEGRSLRRTPSSFPSEEKLRSDLIWVKLHSLPARSGQWCHHASVRCSGPCVVIRSSLDHNWALDIHILRQRQQDGATWSVM